MTVRPYVDRMTRSELLTLITCGMATVASTTLALYVLFLKDSFPLIAGHLVSASIMSIPAAALASKLILPETEVPATLGGVPPMAALMDGSWEGLKLAAGIATLLIAILGLVALIDYGLIKVTAPLSDMLAAPVDLRRILGWLFTPLAWLLGIFIGGIGALAPARRGDLSSLGIRALVGATLATLMTGALAGFYYYGQTGLLGI